jgi:putative membrane protein
MILWVKKNMLELAVAVIYITGLVGLTVPCTAPVFQQLIGLNVLTANILLLWLHDKRSTRFFVSSLLICVLGFLVEVAGVKTGIIFGEYKYGWTLGPGTFDVPFLIGLNWLFMVYTSSLICRRLLGEKGIVYRSLLGSVCMVCYDIVLEPAAIRFEMWSWKDSIIPIQNYIAWFIVGFILSFLWNKVNASYKNRMGVYLFVIQFVFFLLLWVTGRIV